MNLAFELTPDDALAALTRLNLPTDDASVTRAFEEITRHEARVVRVALMGEDLDEQTTFASEEIEDLLRALHHLPPREPGGR